MANKEIWEPICGFNDFYEASNLGNVRSRDRVISYSDGRVRKYKSKKLKPQLWGSTYLTVILAVNGKNTTKNVHSLVAEAFLEKEKYHQCVNHIDGVKTNNKLENLEFCTYSQNSQHAYNTNLKLPASNLKPGKNHPCYKGATEATPQNGGDVILMNGNKEIEDAGFKPASVCRCIKGGRKSHKGYTFRRIDKDEGVINAE